MEQDTQQRPNKSGDHKALSHALGATVMSPPLRSPADIAKAGTVFLSCSNHLYYLALNPPVVLVNTWGPH